MCERRNLAIPLKIFITNERNINKQHKNAQKLHKRLVRYYRLPHITQALYLLTQRSGSSSPTSTELLKQLHWLPIEWCIRFKLATLTFKALHTGHPPYLADLLHKPTKSTRSAASQLLSVLWQNLSFGSRAFCISTPKIWNFLRPYFLTFCNCKLLILFKDLLLSVGPSHSLAPIPNAP